MPILAPISVDLDRGLQETCSGLGSRLCRVGLHGFFDGGRLDHGARSGPAGRTITAEQGYREPEGQTD